ncbi:MAG: hypothetical protein F4018_18325 [Acidobacteria bacterium]|nr:hypothetical protein [Acidobacteriota bacterium]MYK90135.1 hypothetical protein [Acidobacteriota bacterium]
MKRKRLEMVRDRLRELRPAAPADPRDHDRPATDETALCRSAKHLPAIDTFDFQTFHAACEKQTAGCIAGVVIGLFPAKAAREFDKFKRNGGSHGVDRHLPDIIAQRVIGLDEREGDQLFLAGDKHCACNTAPVTPEEAATAVERLLAGIDAESIWDHRAVGDCETYGDESAQKTAEEQPGEDATRDFLDRRDEARISHRLGRPFRF